ncbi:MAG: trypsin-like peptidase domain-containing protein [Vicinamibacterales bacterium]
MPIRRLILAVLLLACGFAAGLVITGRMRAAGEADAQAGNTPAAAGQAVAAPAGVAPGALPDFTTIAERTVPAVANISSQQVVRRNSPFANDPLFRYFFGDDPMLGGRSRVESSLGSGVIVSNDGYILTNNHVIAGESGRIAIDQLPDITVSLSDNREIRAEIVGVDPATDLALLKIDAQNLPTMPWGDSSRLKVAEWVLAVGNPFQLNQSVTLGIVSAVGRRNVGISAYEDFIQTDAAINPGNSGGALINGRGELVGINTAIFSQSGGYQGIGFAVPSNLARRVVSDLQQFGEVRRGSIGDVWVAPLDPRLARQLDAADARGLVVQRMYRNSPAFEGGLRPGDIIVSFNGTAVTDSGQLMRLIQDARIGSTAAVGIVRDGQRVELEIPVRSTGRQ